MKKIIIATLVIVFIPFIIVYFYNQKELKEIELNYFSNTIVRVKRLETDTVENIPLEEYVLGVLAGEMPTYFDIEALKAQAVASRSYVLKRLDPDKEYDVVDSVMNQVYLDPDYLKEVWKDDYVSKINKLKTAVNETLDEYLEYDGEVIDALFFSTSNDYTEDSDIVFNIELPYLKSVESKWDATVSSAYQSTKNIALDKFYELLALPYNDNLNIEVTERSKTNRIIKLKINNQEFKATDVYNKLSLRSTDFTITKQNTNVQIDTKGYGHGVGMSQFGAQGMALEGYSYREILAHYYTATNIKKITN